MHCVRVEETNDGFGNSIVVGVVRGTHRRVHSGILEPLAVSNGQILNALVALRNQPFADLAGAQSLRCVSR